MPVWGVWLPETDRFWFSCSPTSRKARNIAATGAEVLVTANPGCLMQVASSLERQGTRIGLAHTIEVLDASIRGLPVSTLGPQH